MKESTTEDEFQVYEDELQFTSKTQIYIWLK